jgi:hypothetical protein
LCSSFAMPLAELTFLLGMMAAQGGACDSWGWGLWSVRAFPEDAAWLLLLLPQPELLGPVAGAVGEPDGTRLEPAPSSPSTPPPARPPLPPLAEGPTAPACASACTPNR